MDKCSSSETISDAASRRNQQMEYSGQQKVTTEEEQPARAVGDRALEGDGIPVENTFCTQLVDVQLPNVIQDARNDERVNDLDVMWDAGIGSYVGIPLRFSNGQIYGILCCLNDSSDSAIRECDAQFMSVIPPDSRATRTRRSTRGETAPGDQC